MKAGNQEALGWLKKTERAVKLKKKDLRKGVKVYWTDPSEGLSSGYYKVIDVCGEIISLKNSAGSEAEVFFHELSWEGIKMNKKQYTAEMKRDRAKMKAKMEEPFHMPGFDPAIPNMKNKAIAKKVNAHMKRRAIKP